MNRGKRSGTHYRVWPVSMRPLANGSIRFEFGGCKIGGPALGKPSRRFLVEQKQLEVDGPQIIEVSEMFDMNYGAPLGRKALDGPTIEHVAEGLLVMLDEADGSDA